MLLLSGTNFKALSCDNFLLSDKLLAALNDFFLNYLLPSKQFPLWFSMSMIVFVVPLEFASNSISIFVRVDWTISMYLEREFMYLSAKVSRFLMNCKKIKKN